MCGIVGIVGQGDAAPRLIEGLRRLEYRGYDSAGVATVVDGRIERRRAEGKLANLESVLAARPLAGSIGIGHTRWATHGVPNERNAHPHATERSAVVHNGIIENYRELKRQLGPDVAYASETDSEVLAHLIAAHYSGNLLAAVKAALRRVRGTYGLAVVHADEPGRVVVARLGSPLAIGIGDGEHYIASDATPILAEAGVTRQADLTFNGYMDGVQFTPIVAAVRDALAAAIHSVFVAALPLVALLTLGALVPLAAWTFATHDWRIEGGYLLPALGSLFLNVIANLAFFRALQDNLAQAAPHDGDGEGGRDAPVIVLLTPVVASMGAWVILDESLSGLQLLGGAVTLAAIVAVTRRHRAAGEGAIVETPALPEPAVAGG